MKPHIVLNPLVLLPAFTALFLLVGIAYAEPRPSPTLPVQASAAATRAPATPGATPVASPAKAPKAGRPGDDHDRYGFSLARHQTKADGSPFACADCHPKGVRRTPHLWHSTAPILVRTARLAMMALTGSQLTSLTTTSSISR